MKLKKLTKPIRIATAIILGSSACVVMADPVFTYQTSQGRINLFVSNNSSNKYSCNVKFNYAEWQSFGSPDQYGNCNYPYSSPTPLNTVPRDGSCHYLINNGNSRTISPVNVDANISNKFFDSASPPTTNLTQVSLGLQPLVIGNVINASCSVVDNRANQTISFSKPSASAVNVNGTLTAKATANGGSSNSISITSQTPSVCSSSISASSSSVSVATVTGLAGGKCTLAANKSGDSGYKNAPQVTASITVNKLPQTITANVSSVAMGSTGTLSAKSSSGLPVSISAVANKICNVSINGAIKGLSKGDCKVVVNQSGNGSYKPATQTFVIKVFDAAGLMPIIDLLLNDN